MEKKNCLSGLELLRILSIIMIICIHAFGLVQNMAVTEVGRQTTKLVNCICNIGVSCFILISGYFGVSRNFRKMLKLEFVVIFWSLCTSALLFWAFPESLLRSQETTAL